MIGVGNRLRGDDAAGLEVAGRIRAGGAASIPVLELDGEPSRLIDAWTGVDRAVVIDAALSGAPPGDVRRFVATDAPLPAGLRGVSTHDLGLADAVELARALGRLPGRLVVYAIEGESFEAGAPLSATVTAGIAEIADRALADARA